MRKGAAVRSMPAQRRVQQPGPKHVPGNSVRPLQQPIHPITPACPAHKILQAPQKPASPGRSTSVNIARRQAISARCQKKVVANMPNTTRLTTTAAVQTTSPRQAIPCSPAAVSSVPVRPSPRDTQKPRSIISSRIDQQTPGFDRRIHTSPMPVILGDQPGTMANVVVNQPQRRGWDNGTNPHVSGVEHG